MSTLGGEAPARPVARSAQTGRRHTASNAARVAVQLFVALLLAARLTGVGEVEPVRYHVTFPEPEHHWLRVEAIFPTLGPEPLDLRMSRASPGRYSLHEFAKNVYGVRAFDASGREIGLTRVDASGWRVAGHGGTLRVVYDVFGDQLDGTYLGVDSTHALINMPAAIMWGRGLDDRPAVVTFAPPQGRDWRVATQLFPGATPLEFTSPNLQYLMDSPTGRALQAIHDSEIAALVLGIDAVALGGLAHPGLQPLDLRRDLQPGEQAARRGDLARHLGRRRSGRAVVAEHQAVARIDLLRREVRDAVAVDITPQRCLGQACRAAQRRGERRRARAHGSSCPSARRAWYSRSSMLITTSES